MMETRKFNPNDHLIQLKGKDYLQVMWRLVWFREDKPLWAITTQMISHDTDSKHCIFKAEILDENGFVRATGTGSESMKDFGDYIEKAETKAVGRALAMLGYGTQFAPELDEEERIVDSPVPKKVAAKKAEGTVNAVIAEIKAAVDDKTNNGVSRDVISSTIKSVAGSANYKKITDINVAKGVVFALNNLEV